MVHFTVPLASGKRGAVGTSAAAGQEHARLTRREARGVALGEFVLGIALPVEIFGKRDREARIVDADAFQDVAFQADHRLLAGPPRCAR